MRASGEGYENKAADIIRKQGLRILARNFAGKTGEIDIIALDRDYLVFLEVRARSNPYFLSAAASVDRHKQRRILLTAQLFLQRNKRWSNYPCRFDVIAFEPRQSTTGETVNWIRAAFTA